MKKKLFFILVFLFIAILILGLFVLLTKPEGQSMPAPQSGTTDGAPENNFNLPDPEFTKQTILIGLNKPWDIVFLPDNTILFTEKSGNINTIVNGIKVIIEKPDEVFNVGEGGMMGMTIDPEFSTNRFIYTCFNTTINGAQKPEVRVARWKLSIDGRSLSDRKDIVTGMPSKITGRHSGCQLEFGPDNLLFVGTGDTAAPTFPQDPKNLGGKILRVDRDGNAAPTGNLQSPFDTRIFSYGHRNTQGLLMFSEINAKGWYGFSVEHGSDRDDEVNPIVSGNFGWDPVSPTNKLLYNESVNMTDKVKFPDAIASVWSSGLPTIATSGGTIIRGSQWKGWNGALAIGVQKGNMVKILKVDRDGKIVGETQILTDIGRVRTVQQDKEGNLYVLTDNAGDLDVIYKLVAVK